MTVNEAVRDARVVEVLRRFVETQDEWAAEAEALLAVAELLPVFGQGRDWHVGEVGRRLLVRRRSGRWALRGQRARREVVAVAQRLEMESHDEA